MHFLVLQGITSQPLYIKLLLALVLQSRFQFVCFHPVIPTKLSCFVRSVCISVQNWACPPSFNRLRFCCVPFVSSGQCQQMKRWNQSHACGCLCPAGLGSLWALLFSSLSFDPACATPAVVFSLSMFRLKYSHFHEHQTSPLSFSDPFLPIT